MHKVIILFSAHSSVMKLFTEVIQEKRKLLFEEELHFQASMHQTENPIKYSLSIDRISPFHTHVSRGSQK